MTEVRISDAHDQGGDVLRVRGYVDGEWVEAFGWVSAITNHYDPEDYWPEDAPPQVVTDEDERIGREHMVEVAGHLKADAKPRKMTKAERLAYFESLLLAAAPSEGTILFDDPEVPAPTPS